MNHASYIIGASSGGSAISNHFRALARELQRRGSRTALITYGKEEDSPESIEGLEVYRWPSARPTQIRDGWFLYNLIRQQRTTCLVGNFGAVNMMMTIGYLAGVPKRVSWYRTLLAQNELDSNGAASASGQVLRKRIIYGFATHIIANSLATQRELVQIFNVPISRTVVFHNALPDPYSLYPKLHELKPSPRRLVCVGRLFPSKGQDILLHAAALLISDFPDLEIVFVGSGPNRSAYESLANNLGIAKHCRFLGSASRETVYCEFARSFVAVVPSREEAFGLVNLESMSVGTPVIASNVGGIPEVVRNGVDGLLVPPNDPTYLADQLRRVLTDTAIREQLGSSARKRFLEQFEANSVITKQADWFESIVQ